MSQKWAQVQSNHIYANIKKLEDLPDQFLRELQGFFVNYHKLEAKE